MTSIWIFTKMRKEKEFLINLIILSFVFIFSLTTTNAQYVFGKRKNKKSDELSVNYSSPKEYEIASIKVEGIKYLDNNAIISLSGLRVGDKIKIPGDEISFAIKKLWKQGIIGNISINAEKIEGNQVWLVIQLTERPRLTRYEIRGVNRTIKGELEDKVELVKGKVLTDVLIKNTELTILEYMKGKGFLDTKVRITQKADTILRNSALLDIRVNKGLKVKIRNIRFHDNDKITSAKLRSKMKKTGMLPKFSLPTEIIDNAVAMVRKPKRLVDFLFKRKDVNKHEFREYLATHVNLNIFKSGKYVPKEFKNDKASVIAYYNAKGYRDAKIVSDTTYNISKKYMNILMNVDEGKRYYIRDINWTGNYLYTDNQLGKVFGVRKGDVYNLENINKKLNYNPNGSDVSSLYMDDGYLFFNIKPVEVAINGDSVDLEMRMYEGTQATINKVTINGNEKTNDFVVLRELRTLPGYKFSRSDIIRTQRELSQLGYFDPQKINPVPIPDPVNETVDIQWNLEEKSNDQVQLQGGWGGAFGFVGTVGLSFNNFSLRNIAKFEKWRPLPVGDGQRLSINFQANGRSFVSYSIGFSEPWLGGRKPNSFGVNFNQSFSRSLDRTASKTLGYLKVTGISLSLGRRVSWPDDFFVMSNSLAYQRYDLFNYGRGLGFSTGSSNSITFNTTLARRSVDNPLYPRSGSELSISASLTPPFSLLRNLDYSKATNAEKYKWLEYHKWNFDSKHYLTLKGKLVLATRLHFGYLGSYSGKVGVGPFERFKLGGSGLTGRNFLLGTDVVGLRGYDDGSLFPRDPDNNTIFGGTLFSKYVMELRYPVTTSPTATIYGMAFLEAGNNWARFSEFNPYNVKKSAGVGVRIFMPAFGLLGFDWAYGFDRLPGQSDNAGARFHFSIGQQIR